MAFDLIARLKLEDNASDPLVKVLRQVDKTKEATDKAGDSAGRFERELDKVGLTAKKVADATGKVSNKITGFVKTATKTVAIGTTAMAAGVTAFGVSATRDFMTFDDRMNTVFTLLPDYAEEAMDKMRKDTIRFAGEMAAIPQDIVPALYSAISAGVADTEVFDFLEVAQKTAKGGVTDIAVAVDGLTSVVNAYGTDVVNAQQASDLMFVALKLGKTNIDEMSKSLFNVIPTASALGVQFEDVTAAIATMTAMGTPTSVVTTQMRQLFVELSKSTAQASKIFEGLSGKSFKRFIAEGGNTQEALQILERGAAKAGLGINDLFSSVEAGSAALSLTGGGTEAFTKALKEMENSAGATEAAYKRSTQGLSYQIDRLKSKFASFKLNVGGRISAYIMDQVPQMEAAWGRLEQFVKTRYTDNEYFRGLTLAGKVNFVLADIREEYDKWYSAGGREQIANITNKVTKFMTDMLILAGQPFLDAGIHLGKTLGLGLAEGLQQVVADHPALALLIGAGGGALAGSRVGGAWGAVAGGLLGIGATAAVGTGAITGFRQFADNTETKTVLVNPLDDFIAQRNADISKLIGDPGADTVQPQSVDMTRFLPWDMQNKHAGGLSYVPYDNYPAALHRGERVLTAGQNEEYSAGGGRGGRGGSVSLQFGDIYISGGNSTSETVDELMREMAQRINAAGGLMAFVG